MYSFMVVPREQGLPFEGPCPTCTSIIDGIDGAVPHITQAVFEHTPDGRGTDWMPQLDYK